MEQTSESDELLLQRASEAIEALNAKCATAGAARSDFVLLHRARRSNATFFHGRILGAGSDVVLRVICGGVERPDGSIPSCDDGQHHEVQIELSSENETKTNVAKPPAARV